MATSQHRPVTAALWAGLVLTVLATLVPYLDRAASGALFAHVQAAYPEYSAARTGEVVATWLAILTGVGVVGVVCWLVSIRVVASGRVWARWLVTTSFAAGTLLVLFLATIRENTGDIALPPMIGWAWAVPSLAGMAAVVLMWQRHMSGGRDRALANR